MPISLTVDDKNVIAKLEKATDVVKDALERGLKPVAVETAHNVRANLLAHIRFEGTAWKRKGWKPPGSLVASVYGNSFRGKSLVGGFVRSAHPLAHLIEHGYTYKDQIILPVIADVLAFYWPKIGKMAILNFVHRKTMQVQAYDDFSRAFDSAKPKIVGAIEQAAAVAASELR